MAFLIQEPNSPFWYIKFRDPNTGRWRRTSTKFRVGVGTETRKAREQAAEYALRESREAPVNQKETFASWAAGYIGSLKLSPLTVDRYQAILVHIMAFFAEQSIAVPRQVSYATCKDYLAWRINAKNKGRRRKPPCHNTAVLELKVLSKVMGEAVRRGFITGNPCRELGIGKEKPREKPELTDATIEEIRAALATKPEWMRDAFELAIHHGCRISETKVPMDCIDLERGVIYFPMAKGDKPFSVPLHPALFSLAAKKKEGGAQYFADLPAGTAAATRFHKFFKQLGLGLEGVSFHSTRVSVVTRLARSKDVKPDIAMRYVNHSSELVHRIYQRLNPGDLGGVSGALAIPPSSSANTDTPS